MKRLFMSGVLRVSPLIIVTVFMGLALIEFLWD
jgi:hypothetical protein